MHTMLPFLSAFAGSLVLTLLLTPVVRELNRRLGMVDKPDPRRINTMPVPRGGGVAIVLGVAISYSLFLLATGRPAMFGLADGVFAKMSALSVAIAAIGLADDKFSLSPKVKLLGQVVVALLVWGWAGLGFSDLWPSLPGWLDCLMTVFWVVGAVNAFNLIDGMDGLACGVALIATVGMAGAIFFTAAPSSTLFHFALAGGILGFLRYNYHPASFFLGDSGSMYLGFVLSTLPLASHTQNSYLVSVGIPLLAMGVPIFDTALAILRRSLRRLIARGGAEATGRVMTADLDHLHHRILRRVGLNQRTAAWILYATAAAGVVIGFLAMALKSRTGGLWLASLAFLAYMVFKDSTVELFDSGRLLERMAHAQGREARRRTMVWSAPFYVGVDLLLLAGVFLLCVLLLEPPLRSWHALRSCMAIRVVAAFISLALFRTYRTVWSRAAGLSWIRLLLACVFGSVAGSTVIYYWPTLGQHSIGPMTLLYAVLSFVALMSVRQIRNIARNLFYELDRARLDGRQRTSRVLVYGAGLRYRAFRRELVRMAPRGDRMIVGLLDDDVSLRGKYVDDVRVCGTINDAPRVVGELKADAVVVACEVSDDWLKVVREILAPTGVKITRFAFTEEPL